MLKEEIICFVCPIAILVALLFICKCINLSGWNGGYHTCGGKWVYMQAVGHQYGTGYLYKCDKCGEVEEFMEYREVEE